VEHVLNIARVEKPLGVIVQLGGQTPLKIAHALEKAGLKILGTSPSSIDLSEDRSKCEALMRDLKPLGLEQPEATIAHSPEEVIEKAHQLGFPLLVRPSYVLGGTGMRIIHHPGMLTQWLSESAEVSFEHPVLIDRFLDRATEVDVDAISDGKETFIGGLMEHIEEAGIHSGDSACSLPTATLSIKICDRIRTYTRELAKRLKVVGLMNVQFAIQGDRVFLLEVNPRASRTIPFVSKAVGQPLAKLAVKVILGHSLRELGVTEDFDLNLKTFNVKAPVFPFGKFPGVDVLLGPEMKSTGEVMGRANSFAGAYAKALAAAGMQLPHGGNAFLSIRNEDKAEVLLIARGLSELGFALWATSGTAQFLSGHGLSVCSIHKVHEGSPHCVEAIDEGRFSLIVNTVSDQAAIRDSFTIRRAALERRIPYTTVISAARMMVEGIREERKGAIEILPL
jgi:carbamoyl-phosphate synthase large subunit